MIKAKLCFTHCIVNFVCLVKPAQKFVYYFGLVRLLFSVIQVDILQNIKISSCCGRRKWRLNLWKFFLDFSSNSGLIPHLFRRFIEMAWTGSQRQFCNCEYRIFRQCFRTFSVGENEIVDRLTWLSRNPPMISLGEFELFEWSVLLLFFECQTRLLSSEVICIDASFDIC